jgi:hypothetical protein
MYHTKIVLSKYNLALPLYYKIDNYVIEEAFKDYLDLLI